MSLLLVSRTQSKLDDVSAEIKKTHEVEAETVAVDFGDVDITARARLEAAIKSKDVGVLINNVGMGYDFPMYTLELSDKESETMTRVNVDSVLMMTRLVLPGMVDRKRGAVVNISTASALLPSPLLAVYSGTKSFVELFTRALAIEYGGQGIDVQVQSPLYVTTKLAKIRKVSWSTPSPEQYARAAVGQIGYEVQMQPWWGHAFLMGILLCLPERLVVVGTAALHKATRAKGMKKRARLAKEVKAQ